MEDPDGIGGPRKRPYDKPDFTWEPVFETSALSCGKLSVLGGACNAYPNSPGSGTFS